MSPPVLSAFRFATEAQWDSCLFVGADRQSAMTRRGLHPFAPYAMPPKLTATNGAHGPAVSEEGDLLWLDEGFLAGVTSGQPGQGRLFVWKPGDAKPLFESAKRPNCHSLARHGNMLAHSATNANSSGNGKVKGKDGDYPANTSPIQLWELPKG